MTLDDKITYAKVRDIRMEAVQTLRDTLPDELPDLPLAVLCQIGIDNIYAAEVNNEADKELDAHFNL